MNYIKGVIDREEGEFLVIKLLDSDQEILWQKKNINFTFNDGDIINLALTKDEPETINQEDQAKNLLKQIFQTNV